DTVAMARPKYDVVFIDAQAGADDFAREAMDPAVSDTVVLVSEYDPVSAAGVERLKALFPDSLTYSRTWILLNKGLPEYAESFSVSRESARSGRPIRWSAGVVRASARRSLALDFRRGVHPLAVTKTLRTLLPDDLAADLDAWLEQQSTLV